MQPLDVSLWAKYILWVCVCGSLISVSLMSVPVSYRFLSERTLRFFFPLLRCFLPVEAVFPVPALTAAEKKQHMFSHSASIFCPVHQVMVLSYTKHLKTSVSSGCSKFICNLTVLSISYFLMEPQHRCICPSSAIFQYVIPTLRCVSNKYGYNSLITK